MPTRARVKRTPPNSDLKPGEVRELDGFDGEDDTVHVMGTPADPEYWYHRDYFEKI